MLRIVTSAEQGPDSSTEALAAAVERRDEAAVASLLADGADPNGLDGVSVLASATGFGGFDVSTGDGHVPLLPEHLGIVRSLLDAGAEPDGCGTFDRPLVRAAEAGWHRTAALLIEAGADVGGRGNNGSTPLHLAATYRRRQVIEVLLGAGASPVEHDDFGRRPVDVAHDDVRTILARATAEVTHRSPDDPSRRPMHVVLAAAAGELVTLGVYACSRWDVTEPGSPVHLASGTLRREPRAALVHAARVVTVGGGEPRLDEFAHLPIGFPRPSAPVVTIRPLDALDAEVEIDLGGNFALRDVAVSPDGTRLAACGMGGVWLLDADSATRVAHQELFGARSLTYAPDGAHLVVTTDDGHGGPFELGTMAVTDSTLGTFRVFPGRSSEGFPFVDPCFDPAGTALFVVRSGAGELVRFDWDARAPTSDRPPTWTARVVDRHRSEVAMLVVDDATVVCSTGDGLLTVVDAVTGEIRRTRTFRPPMIAASIARDPTGRFWVAGSRGLAAVDDS